MAKCKIIHLYFHSKIATYCHLLQKCVICFLRPLKFFLASEQCSSVPAFSDSLVGSEVCNFQRVAQCAVFSLTLPFLFCQVYMKRESGGCFSTWWRKIYRTARCHHASISWVVKMGQNGTKQSKLVKAVQKA